MRTSPLFAGAFLAVAALALSSPLAAQQGAVVTPREMNAALEAHEQNVEADRAVVARVLSRADVEAAARDAGFGERLEDARAAARNLEGEGLSRAASYARAIEGQLAGGQSITISAITLIVILLLVILIIMIAN